VRKGLLVLPPVARGGPPDAGHTFAPIATPPICFGFIDRIYIRLSFGSATAEALDELLDDSAQVFI
jgi:hypothetical protein